MIQKRYSRWKLAGIVVGTLLLSGVLLVFWIVSNVERRTARMERGIPELTSKVRLRNPVRPILRGTSVPGDATVDYVAAEAGISRTDIHEKLRHGLENLTPSNLALLNKALPGHQGLIDLLRSGALRETASARDSGYRESPLSLASLVLLAARSSASEGKSRQAAETILDVCQYGWDIADSPLHLGIGVLQRAFHEARDQMLAGQFDREALVLLERGWESLDASFPPTNRFYLESALSIALDARTVRQPTFPRKQFDADASVTFHDLYLRAGASYQFEWKQEQRALKDLDQELASSWNPFARQTFLGIEWRSQYFRNIRAELRLLRLSAHYLATGDVLDLEDPFGDRLKTQHSEGLLKAWSVGADGIDDGGSGDWTFKAKDIVLEVHR